MSDMWVLYAVMCSFSCLCWHEYILRGCTETGSKVQREAVRLTPQVGSQPPYKDEPAEDLEPDTIVHAIPVTVRPLGHALESQHGTFKEKLETF